MYKHFFKRAIDLLLSFIGIIVLTPVWLILTIAIFINDPGPIFFTQKRVGKKKKLFKILKFRTMKTSTPHDMPTHMLENPEQYITKVGGFLRKTSLDELPQIFNIFAGQMSIIGPRPALWNQDDLIAERDKYGANDVKPGLTGWAQINGRDELEIPVKAKLDGEYVEKMSFGFDCKCFFGTIKSVLKHDGVVEGGTGELHKEALAAEEKKAEEGKKSEEEKEAEEEKKSEEEKKDKQDKQDIQSAEVAATSVAEDIYLNDNEDDFYECVVKSNSVAQKKKIEQIAIITPNSSHVIGFRKNLMQLLIEKGEKVSVIAFDNEYEQDAIDEGADFYCLSDNNRSTNPFKILSLKNRYKHLIKKINPDIVMTFQLKPNLFGVLGAKKAGVKNIYSMVEGAGDVFINSGLKWKIIRAFVCKYYKKAFKNSKIVFFLNEDDKNEFISRGLVKESQCEIIHGIGVDLEKFSYKPIKNHATFLMVARMLKTKGVYEYCECARLVKQKYPNAIFNYIGGEGTVKLSDIQQYIDDGSINYLGTKNDVRPYYEDCSVYILPSYREGMPMSVMEAEAVGRGVITTNVVGCKDTVINGYNGFIVPCYDIEKMVEKVVWYIENPQKVEEMGRNARKYTEENFDQKKINERISRLIENDE